jgi:hypothetical protein
VTDAMNWRNLPMTTTSRPIHVGATVRITLDGWMHNKTGIVDRRHPYDKGWWHIRMPKLLTTLMFDGADLEVVFPLAALTREQRDDWGRTLGSADDWAEAHMDDGGDA